MLGGSCSPCCCPCSEIDNKPCTDPADEGTWVPVTPWPDRTITVNLFPYAGIGVAANWSFVDRETHGPGETWYFAGSDSTSKVGGNATTLEQQDWGNLCNWYSARSNAPQYQGLLQQQPAFLTKRATRFPDENSVIHVFSPISTQSVGPRVVKAAYFWSASGLAMTTATTEITATDTIFSTDFVSVGMLFYGGRNFGVLHGGAAFIDPTGYTTPFSRVSGGNGGNATGPSYNNSNGVVNGGALFSGAAFNWATVNGGAEFHTRFSRNRGGAFDGGGHTGGFGVVNGGAKFIQGAINQTFAIVNGGAMFFQPTASGGSAAQNLGVVNGGGEFNDNTSTSGTVNDGAVFNDSSLCVGNVNGGAVFNQNSRMDLFVVVNGGAAFFDNSKLTASSFVPGTFVGGTVNGGATFNDAACSERIRTVGGVRFFVAHPTDFPTCNGTAPPGSDLTATCGCN